MICKKQKRTVEAEIKKQMQYKTNENAPQLSAIVHSYGKPNDNTSDFLIRKHSAFSD